MYFSLLLYSVANWKEKSIVFLYMFNFLKVFFSISCTKWILIKTHGFLGFFYETCHFIPRIHMKSFNIKYMFSWYLLWVWKMMLLLYCSYKLWTSTYFRFGSLMFIHFIFLLKGHYLPNPKFLLPVKTIRYDWCLTKTCFCNL